MGVPKDKLAFAEMQEKRRKTYAANRERRFWANVDCKAEWECWHWKRKFSKRYPSYCEMGAHRYSYELHYGPVPDGLVVMHVCDNTACVNPHHLRIGSQATNRADCVQKNRHAKGSRQGHSRFTEYDIRQIRTRRSSGELLRKIAKDYKTSPAVISGIALGNSWRHV